MSWTGSENERKPQGICLPPSKPSDLREKWTIPAGTSVMIQPIGGSDDQFWSHTTKKELGFRKCEDSKYGMGKFREQGYFIWVFWNKVAKRE